MIDLEQNETLSDILQIYIPKYDTKITRQDINHPIYMEYKKSVDQQTDMLIVEYHLCKAPFDTQEIEILCNEDINDKIINRMIEIDLLIGLKEIATAERIHCLNTLLLLIDSNNSNIDRDDYPLTFRLLCYYKWYMGGGVLEVFPLNEEENGPPFDYLIVKLIEKNVKTIT